MITPESIARVAEASWAWRLVKDPPAKVAQTDLSADPCPMCGGPKNVKAQICQTCDRKKRKQFVVPS